MEFSFSELMVNCIIRKYNLVAFTTQGFNYDEFNLKQLQSELRNYPSICLRTEKKQENQCQGGVSQDI
jgi:hypothetical protein